MFFFSTPLHRVHIPSGTFNHRCQPRARLGHSYLVFGSLAMVFGFVSLLLTISNDENKLFYVIIGSLCLVFGSILTILTCFFDEFVSCYNNWIYRTRITPTQIVDQTPVISTVIDIIDENWSSICSLFSSRYSFDFSSSSCSNVWWKRFFFFLFFSSNFRVSSTRRDETRRKNVHFKFKIWSNRLMNNVKTYPNWTFDRYWPRINKFYSKFMRNLKLGNHQSNSIRK